MVAGMPQSFLLSLEIGIVFSLGGIGCALVLLVVYWYWTNSACIG